MAEPHRVGVRGCYWELDREALCSSGDATATVLAVYLLDVPSAHPAWDCYLLSIIHLRDVPGIPAAHREFPTATHEILLWALNPESDASWNGIAFPPEGRFLLTPPNLIEQVELPSDEYALELVALLARAFIDGILSPDTDFRRMQQQAIRETALHMREGRHVLLKQ
jgi:hypothetical protein